MDRRDLAPDEQRTLQSTSQGRTWRISWVGSFSALVDLPVRSTCSILMNLFIN